MHLELETRKDYLCPTMAAAPFFMTALTLQTSCFFSAALSPGSPATKPDLAEKSISKKPHSAMLGFKNGAVGFIEGGGARKYFNFELDIQGSEGRILIGNSGRELYITKKSRRFTGFHELEKVPFPEPKKYESPFIGGAREMLKTIRTGKAGTSTGIDGLRALEIISAVYQSAQQKGKRVIVG